MDMGQQPKWSIERGADQTLVLCDVVDESSNLVPRPSAHRFDLEKLGVHLLVEDMTDRFFTLSHDKGAQCDRVESNAGLNGC